MDSQLFDRIWETSTTTGTGTLTLAGARTGYQAFSIVGNGTKVPYLITNGTDFEIGEGIYSSSTLTRATIFSSSNSNSAVNFGAGTKDVILSMPAKYLTEINVEDSFISAEPISGGRAVSFNSSGAVQIAMASIPSRTPAVGIVVDNVASGQATRVYNRGSVRSSQFNFSGYIGKPVWVGASGNIISSGLPVESGNIHIPLGTITSHSGLLMGSPYMGSGSVFHDAIASGVVEWHNLASGAIRSGSIASGQIGIWHLASGQIFWFAHGSGSVLRSHMASGIVDNTKIANASIFANHMASGSVASGNIASGQIETYALSSGTTVNRAIFTGPFVSGTSWTMLTEEIVSGTKAVCISQSGHLRVAMASVSGRMPAIGVVVDNVASGIQANVFSHGVFQTTSGMANYSGQLGQALYVGRSGHIVSMSGTFNSGGFLSGDIYQRIGTAFNSGGVVIQLSEAFKLASG